MHLFDIDVPGKITFRESDTLSPGQAITVVDTDAGRLGVGICYDIRFPELAALCAQRGAQLIVYPGAPQFPLRRASLDAMSAQQNMITRFPRAGEIYWGCLHGLLLLDLQQGNPRDKDCWSRLSVNLHVRLSSGLAAEGAQLSAPWKPPNPASRVWRVQARST